MFKDVIKEITLPQIEITKLKGHTKIELTDIHTGKKEVIEHDNAITTGLQSYLRELGFGRNDPFIANDVTNKELWKTLLGGIYLFDTVLPDTAKYKPAGTLMTGNSYFECANLSDPTELGSYNATESAFDNNHISLVYDWGTSQGNGTIATVSLGTLQGGKIGYGNSTSLAATALQSVIGSQSNNYYNAQQMNNVLYYNNHVYRATSDDVSNGTTSVTIYKNIFPITKVDVFGKVEIYNAADYPENIVFTLPEAVSGAYKIVPVGSAYKSCFMLIPRDNVAAGATVTFYLLDVSDGTVTKKTFVNNTGALIFANSGIFLMLLDSTYAIVRTGGNTGAIYKINYTNGAVIGEATKNGMGDNNVRQEYSACAFTDQLYAFCRCDNYLYDPVKNAFYPTNGYIGAYASSELFSYIYLPDEDCIASYRWYGRNKRLGVYKNPLRLMTINNLDTPVEKTASKTMKVTYTITRAS